LRLNLPLARGYKGELAIRKDDAKGGIENLRDCLEELRAMRFELSISCLNIPLAQALGTIGEFAEGIALVDDAIRRAEAGGHLLYVPELLRVKGDLLLRMPGPHDGEAQMCFNPSLAVSRSQGALSWELRTATSLAALRRKQGRVDEARSLLAPVYGRSRKDSIPPISGRPNACWMN
jgi:predicted ATPase